MKRLLTLLFPLLSWIPIQAAEHLLWKNIPVGNMPMAVHAITRAGNGLIWLGTDYGLFGYDGYKIYGYGPDNGFPGCQIHGVEARNGRLYLGTNNGLQILDTRSGAVRYSVADDNPSEIRAMTSEGNRLWIGALSGLYEYDFLTNELRKCRLDLPHDAVYALLYDRGDLYVGTMHMPDLSLRCGLVDNRADITGEFNDTIQQFSGHVNMGVVLAKDTVTNNRSIDIRFAPSYFQRKNNRWNLSSDRISADSSRIVVDNFTISNSKFTTIFSSSFVVRIFFS